MFCFDFSFPKAAEALNSKMTGLRSSELIGCEMWSLMQKNCVHSVDHKASISKRMSAFSFISMGDLFIDLSSSTIKKFTQHVALEAATRKALKEFANSLLFLIFQGMYSDTPF